MEEIMDPLSIRTPQYAIGAFLSTYCVVTRLKNILNSTLSSLIIFMINRNKVK